MDKQRSAHYWRLQHCGVSSLKWHARLWNKTWNALSSCDTDGQPQETLRHWSPTSRIQHQDRGSGRGCYVRVATFEHGFFKSGRTRTHGAKSDGDVSIPWSLRSEVDGLTVLETRSA
ncbi:hypothetical protein LZ32DRAFT_382222 [Colletotrichum eremochloae]|nr:hypothetical protein LZ32DRAFT_382222 [Colletotrichum eremochloae]